MYVILFLFYESKEVVSDNPPLENFYFENVKTMKNPT